MMVATADNPLTRHQLLNLALPRHQLFNLALPWHQLLNLALRPQVHVVAMLTSVVSLLVVMVVDIVTFLARVSSVKHRNYMFKVISKACVAITRLAHFPGLY